MSARRPIAPVVLEGDVVRLTPLELEHTGALAKLVVGDDLCRFFPFAMQTNDDVARFVEGALASRDAGTALPFVQLDRASGSVAGSTSYLAIEPAHRRAEIGATFVGRAWQRTRLNTEAKRLLFAHAFETLDLLRVELKTDSRNHASRAAMTRLGLREEGTFRRHMVCADGSLRDTVWFAATSDEWPALRARLDALLAGHGATHVNVGRTAG